MRRFRFKLNGLLRMKLAVEKDVKRQLAEIQALCRRKETEIEETEQKSVAWVDYYNEIITKRVNVTELAIIDTHLERLGRFREQLLIGLEILKRKKEDLIQYYQEVRKEVKMLEHIRERKFNEHRQMLIKEEEKQADELAALRFARERLAV